MKAHSRVLAAAAAAAVAAAAVVVVLVVGIQHSPVVELVEIFVAGAVQPGVGQEGSLVLRALLLQLYSQSSLEYQSLLASYGIFLCVCAILHSR